MAEAYIHDGYTRRAYIAAEPRLYPAVRFTYRPILTSDRAVVAAAVRGANPRRGEEIVAACIERYVDEWDIEKQSGNRRCRVELRASEILRLQPRLFVRMYRIVMGIEGGDADPDGDEPEATLEEQLVEVLGAAELEKEAVGN